MVDNVMEENVVYLFHIVDPNSQKRDVMWKGQLWLWQSQSMATRLFPDMVGPLLTTKVTIDCPRREEDRASV